MMLSQGNNVEFDGLKSQPGEAILLASREKVVESAFVTVPTNSRLVTRIAPFRFIDILGPEDRSTVVFATGAVTTVDRTPAAGPVGPFLFFFDDFFLEEVFMIESVCER